METGLEKLAEHRRIWAGKPALRRIYAVWFEALLGAMRRESSVFEIGAGPGFLREHAAGHRPDLRWTSTDLLAAPWNTLAADAARLPLKDATQDAVCGIDTLHHLPDPGGFLKEAARVLKPGGSLLLVEPWVTPLSFPIYRWLHPEGCTSAIDEWHPFVAMPGQKRAFDGNAAVPRCLVRRTGDERWRGLGFAPPRLVRLNAFPYLLSLGFRRGSLLPGPLLAPLLRADRLLAPLAPVTALRALLRWDRLASSPDKGAAQ